MLIEERNLMERVKERGVAKVAVKGRMDEQPDDLSYWQLQSYQARLAALEEIRREYHNWKYNAEPRLQRVCRIIKQQ